MLLLIALLVVFAGILALTLYQRRRGIRPSEADYDAVDDGAVYGRGIGAAHLRQLGVDADEGPRAREEHEPPRFKL